jgi:alpha-L-fucosidase 2
MGVEIHININTEMNYWPAETTNLSECHEPLTRMVTELVENGARTARVHYGANGWVCHHNTDLWRATAPIDGPLWGFWPLEVRGYARIFGIITNSAAISSFCAEFIRS